MRDLGFLATIRIFADFAHYIRELSCLNDISQWDESWKETEMVKKTDAEHNHKFGLRKHVECIINCECGKFRHTDSIFHRLIIVFLVCLLLFFFIFFFFLFPPTFFVFFHNVINFFYESISYITYLRRIHVPMVPLCILHATH